MNNLSWIMYWADVLPGIATGLAVFSNVIALAALFGGVLFITQGFGGWSHNKDYTNRFRHSWRVFAVFLFLALSTNLVPSKDTFYLIAASEASERALQTPEFSKVRQVLNNWMDEQLEEEQQEEPDSN